MDFAHPIDNKLAIFLQSPASVESLVLGGLLQVYFFFFSRDVVSCHHLLGTWTFCYIPSHWSYLPACDFETGPVCRTYGHGCGCTVSPVGARCDIPCFFPLSRQSQSGQQQQPHWRGQSSGFTGKIGCRQCRELGRCRHCCLSANVGLVVSDVPQVCSTVHHPPCHTHPPYCTC